jgi:hypothetical protein
VTGALMLFGYAIAVAWCAPVLLTPLTSRGVRPRLGLAAWLAAMGSAIAALALGAERSAAIAADDWPQLTAALCRSVAGGVCTPQVYRSALYEAGVTIFATVVTLLLLTALWRYGRRVQRGIAGTRSHARAALLVGQAIGNAAPPARIAPAAEAVNATATGYAAGIAGPVLAGGDGGGTGARRGPSAVVLDDPRPAAYRVAGDGGGTGARRGARAVVLDDPRPAAYCVAGDGGGTGARRGARAVVLDDPRPAAYCVAGRPAAIVVTSGALAVLDQPQLAAVLSHERAHLAGRHHALRLLTRGLTAAFPGVPLFTRGSLEIARLTEMAADDAAARANGRQTVLAALLALATPTAPLLPRPGLAAAAYAVPSRVERLLRPPPPALSTAFAAALTISLAVLAVVPPLLTALTSR